jgi:hypothetical protein
LARLIVISPPELASNKLPEEMILDSSAMVMTPVGAAKLRAGAYKLNSPGEADGDELRNPKAETSATVNRL